MSSTTYGNDQTGGITVVIEDVDNKDTDQPEVSEGKDITESDDNPPRPGHKRGSVTVSSFPLYFMVFVVVLDQSFHEGDD